MESKNSLKFMDVQFNCEKRTIRKIAKRTIALHKLSKWKMLKKKIIIGVITVPRARARGKRILN